ncbi:hypothetical protein ACFYNA_15485 [Streptomyces sp. NPDC006640]|uniref:hypothetical protein n=1 Tax=Streptomyces sp. NPDC006640 TaxID=3364754 RepID=UPI0036B87C06
MSTPADELRTAAQRLRDVAPDITGPLAGLADPVADWLDAEAQRLTTTAHPDWQEVCSPNAVTVARQILGTAK